MASSNENDIVILSAARTPIGSFLGSLSSVPAPQLGATAIKGAMERAGVTPEQVEQVVMGNVLQAGIGQAPARQAGIFAGIPHTTGAVTIHKVCGSGLKSIMYAANDIRCGEYRLAVAGGMESMSLAPYMLPKGRYNRDSPGYTVRVFPEAGALKQRHAIHRALGAAGLPIEPG